VTDDSEQGTPAASEELERVGDEEITRWVTAAHTARVASYVLAEVRDPRPGTPLAADDDAYPWEKCSAWMRSTLVAALDHLIVWANIVAPQTVFEGMEVRNPPRPYYTLARGGLEAAAQAVWTLGQPTSAERVDRHLRLLYHDLRQMALAFEAASDERAPAVRERMALVEQRVGDAEAVRAIKKGEPKYSMMVRECAEAVDLEPAEIEVLWRGMSAAAHGKNWFQHVGYRTTVGTEYEPGYFRAAMQPDPAGITRSLSAAARLANYGVLRFVTLAGHHPASLYPAALARLTSETQLKPR